MQARRKNQRNKPKNKKQASRALKPAPEKLKAILDLINLVPTDAEMPDAFQLWEELNKQAIEDHHSWYESKQKEMQEARERLGPVDNTRDYTDRLVEHSQEVLDFSQEHMDRTEELGDSLSRATNAVNMCLADLPQSFHNHVWQVGEEPLDSETRIYEALARYTLVREWREKLRLIARLAAGEDKEWPPFLPELRTNARIDVDDEGLIYVARDVFAAAVDGVEAKRIRQCAICHLIFWAGRITQQCCTPACAHALRNRRYRANYKEYLIRRHRKEDQGQQQKSTVTGSQTNKRDHKKGKKS